MKLVGAHVSIAGGIFNAPLNAKAIGATAFALFTKNQRRWRAKPYDPETIERFSINLKEAGYQPEHVLPHDGYLINLGNPDPDKRAQSWHAFIDELQRCSQLGLTSLNIHPGSHLSKITEEQCLAAIAESINSALQETSNVAVVLETTAGQGSNVGYRFEHLADIIEMVEDKSRIGVCLDTCHIFAAGYDIRTRTAYEKTMSEFDRVIGFSYLRGVHLNDAKVALGARVDRHQSLGKGTLGLDPFGFIMNDPRFEEIPMVLETIDEVLWPQEICRLYSLATPKAPAAQRSPQKHKIAVLNPRDEK
ncbi:MAG: deoxyribonuclease IV [Chitinivibrionales bacterium]|nr:deoxyribonuclease IV [Chitinivibrionales bacterium]MBD3356432.1 deoxyribonuclease IV [Chitinivibrionales bacterium]